MSEKKNVITRRDFIRAGSVVAMGSLMGLGLLEKASAADPSKSRVILIREKNVLGNGALPVPDILENMLDRGVSALMDTSHAASAWRKLFTPEDVVGIKTNVWYHLPTPAVLEETIQKRLMNLGISEKDIAADDRGVLGNPVFRRSTALINIRPLRTHHWSGLGTLLKNYIMFTETPWMYHGNACERLGSIWHKPEVKNKTRLNILVTLTPLFHGIGPHHFSTRYTWPYCGLIISKDPVAADATGARIIQAKRNAYFKQEKPISPPPLHISAADTRYGLGNSDPQNIELIKLGWKEDALI